MIRVEVSSNDAEEEKAVFEALRKFLAQQVVQTYSVSENPLRREIWIDLGKYDLTTLKQYVLE